MFILQESVRRRDAFKLQIIGNVSAYTLAAEKRLELDNPDHPVPEFKVLLNSTAPIEVADAFKFFAGK